MGESLRVRTKVGINQTINVELNQEFDFLEILSVKLQQADIYTRACSQYGVIVGRVTANNGFGIPNAKVSVFIPITTEDESNPLIQSIYPYKSPSDKNEDGYRYNLLPYEKSYSTHAATGTFPSRLDILTGNSVSEIYDKYYRFTVKTNDSGDYMILGAPLGNQTLVLDVDLSDIGEFSLSPQDLIRMGRATEAQVAGSRFNTSTDLNSLPQIISLVKNVEISPLWGDPEICVTSINRVDFDLRDDASIDIQPTAVFMGSMFSSADKFRVRKNCRPRDNLGNMCDLTTSPGQLLAIRQTIKQDSDGNPILEQYQVEKSGNVIDEDGTWMLELPMNLDYITTNEFGDRIISNDPTIGIPTKSKYRFKVKWQQPNELNIQTRRAYYLIPNVKEYGWNNSNTDPNFNSGTTPADLQFKSSYYFGLQWSGYTNGFSGQAKIDRLNETINCADTFYEFKYNRVYTIASLIDQYKKGGRARFIGIKEIDDDDCNSTSNKFPVNEGFKNFDALYFLFSILFAFLQPLGYVFIILLNVVGFLYFLVKTMICALCNFEILGGKPFRNAKFCKKFDCNNRTLQISLPMIEYPSCTSCECKQETTEEGTGDEGSNSGLLSYFSSPPYYYDTIASYLYTQFPDRQLEVLGDSLSQALGGNQSSKSTLNLFKLPKSNQEEVEVFTGVGPLKIIYISTNLPLGERINIFNGRHNFFTGLNKIKVKFAKSSNIGSDKFHLDNTLTVVSNSQYQAGDVLAFVNSTLSKDPNYFFEEETDSQVLKGISGTSNNLSSVVVNYATSQTTDTSVTYTLPYSGNKTRVKVPQDLEYFQVVTAITISDASKIWNSNTPQSIGNILNEKSTLVPYYLDDNVFGINPEWKELQLSSVWKRYELNPIENFSDYSNQYILILQRGVDPYSPKYQNEYSLGLIFGSTIDDPKFVISADTRLNIPIQKNTASSYVQPFNNQDSIYYSSYFFTPGDQYSGFTSDALKYYGALDNTNNTGVPSITFPQSTSDGRVVSTTSNSFYSITESSSKYGLSEDVSSMGYMYGPETSIISMFYVTKSFDGINFNIGNKVKNVLRTDRLPTSDKLDGKDWATNPAILQQNNNFNIYLLNLDDTSTSDVFANTTDTVPADIEGLPNEENVLESFSCQEMVGLTCYTGYSGNFGIDEKCAETDNVEKGCYVFGKRPIVDLGKDLSNYNQWSYRFKFMYAICRGVLSQTFTNNWINGTLFAFPIQVDVYFDKKNKPQTPRFCRDMVVFDSDTNNFYYRSSPYNNTTKKFIGKPATTSRSLNDFNLLFPTTVINLGWKDSFYSEIIYELGSQSYLMNSLEPTSFGDTSDIVNLFVVSRMLDYSFLDGLTKTTIGDPADELFSRDNSGLFKNEKRVDGDFAQLASINSEVGVVKFSPDYYSTDGFGDDPIKILGNDKFPVICIFFDSPPNDLQIKDFITPNRVIYRNNDNTKSIFCDFEILSQEVPFYQWGYTTASDNIFGDQYNNWYTDRGSIFSRKYQELDRTRFAAPTYFIGPNISFDPTTNFYTNETFARGYIFRANDDGSYNFTKYTGMANKFLVGAPYHFYFGVRKGASALDKFKTKYSISE